MRRILPDESPVGNHYITLHAPLKEEWEPQSGANERLIGGRDIIKDLIVIRNIRRTSRKELVCCFNRLNNRVRGQNGLRICIRVTITKLYKAVTAM
jgi:hypothetical protein